MIRNGRLETERLYVRPFEVGDIDPLVTLFADPAVHRFVDDGEAMDREESELWVRNSRRNVEELGFGTGAIVQKSSGRLIGWAGVARPPDDEPEIIYGFERAAWRKGYGSELLSALTNFCGQQDIDPVRATVAAGNAGSIALLLSAGFELADAAYRGSADSHLYIFSR